MLFSPWKVLFFLSMMLGSLWAMSASSWFFAWVGLEINILASMAIFLSSNSPRNSEASLKYFLVQALASSVLIFSISLSYSMESGTSLFETLCNNIIAMSLLIKLGSAPFHVWVPQVLEGVTWLNMLIILSWQKFAPFILLFLIFPKVLGSIIILSIILSSLVGAVGGLMYSSTRKLVAFSSINHMGWMISALMISLSLWLAYYSVYIILLSALLFIMSSKNMTTLSSSWVKANDSKLLVNITLLSFGGLPPFLGFLPKWMVLNDLLAIYFPFLSLVLAFSSLVTLGYYLRIASTSLLGHNKTNNVIFEQMKGKNFIFALNLSGLLIFSLIFMI